MEAELYNEKEIRAKISGLQVGHNGAQGLLQADVGLGKTPTPTFSPFSRRPHVSRLLEFEANQDPRTSNLYQSPAIDWAI